MFFRSSLESLRSRPKEERKALATTIAIIVFVLLGLGWAFFFFQDVRGTQVPSFDASELQPLFGGNASTSAQDETAPPAFDETQPTYDYGPSGNDPLIDPNSP